MYNFVPVGTVNGILMTMPGSRKSPTIKDITRNRIKTINAHRENAAIAFLTPLDLLPPTMPATIGPTTGAHIIRIVSRTIQSDDFRIFSMLSSDIIGN